MRNKAIVSICKLGTQVVVNHCCISFTFLLVVLRSSTRIFDSNLYVRIILFLFSHNTTLMVPEFCETGAKVALTDYFEPIKENCFWQKSKQSCIMHVLDNFRKKRLNCLNCIRVISLLLRSTENITQFGNKIAVKLWTVLIIISLYFVVKNAHV